MCIGKINIVKLHPVCCRRLRLLQRPVFLLPAPLPESIVWALLAECIAWALLASALLAQPAFVLRSLIVRAGAGCCCTRALLAQPAFVLHSLIVRAGAGCHRTIPGAFCCPIPGVSQVVKDEYALFVLQALLAKHIA